MEHLQQCREVHKSPKQHPPGICYNSHGPCSIGGGEHDLSTGDDIRPILGRGVSQVKAIDLQALAFPSQEWTGAGLFGPLPGLVKIQTGQDGIGTVGQCRTDSGRGTQNVDDHGRGTSHGSGSHKIGTQVDEKHQSLPCDTFGRLQFLSFPFYNEGTEMKTT
jgi:hypothetical protein